jgi:cytosine/adenosine deaminase-related metal-dependent hydrolase
MARGKKGMASRTSRPLPADLIVTNACVLTLDADRRIFPAGAIAIRGRDIAMVGRERDVCAAYHAPRIIDAKGGVVHPGFIDAHYHTTMHLTRAAITDDPRKPALGGGPGSKRRAIYSEWFNALTDEDEHVSALAASLEMARNGYTCFMEPGTVFEPDAVAKAVEAVGIRGSLADPFLWDSTGLFQGAAEVDRAPPTLARCLKSLGRELWRNRDPDALVGAHVAVYGSGSASDDLLRAAKRCADDNGVVLNQHQSFTPEGAAREDARLGRHALVHFAELGVLGPNVTFVHMNVVRDDEIEPIVSSGMSLVWHPGNYLFYGLGAKTPQRMPELHELGVNLAFGHDVAKIWTFGELPYLAYLTARNHGRFIPAESCLEMATIGGAKAMGWEKRIGSLELGKRADLVIRRTDIPEAQPGVNPVLESVLVARSKGVDTVICDGAIIVRGGRSTRLDEAAVYGRARASVRRLMEKTGLKADFDWPVVQ